MFSLSFLMYKFSKSFESGKKTTYKNAYFGLKLSANTYVFLVTRLSHYRKCDVFRNIAILHPNFHFWHKIGKLSNYHLSCYLRGILDRWLRTCYVIRKSCHFWTVFRHQNGKQFFVFFLTFELDIKLFWVFVS